MTRDEELLARVSAATPTKRGRRKVWTQPEVEDFAQGWVLSFDQTLTKTGWVVLCNNVPISGPGNWVREGLHISHGGVLQPERSLDLRSFEETFAKAEAMGREIERIIDQHSWVNTVVHEMPAVAGYRIESSLMAAREIRRANAGRRPVVMVSRQAAYSTLTGQPSSEKRHMTEAVNRLIPDHRRVTERWTQDVHDAAGLALKHLYDAKERP